MRQKVSDFLAVAGFGAGTHLVVRVTADEAFAGDEPIVDLRVGRGVVRIRSRTSREGVEVFAWGTGYGGSWFRSWIGLRVRVNGRHSVEFVKWFSDGRLQKFTEMRLLPWIMKLVM